MTITWGFIINVYIIIGIIILAFSYKSLYKKFEESELFDNNITSNKHSFGLICIFAIILWPSRIIKTIIGKR